MSSMPAAAAGKGRIPTDIRMQRAACMGKRRPWVLAGPMGLQRLQRMTRLWLHHFLTYQMVREDWWRSQEGALDDALMRSMPHPTAPGARASPCVKWSDRFQVAFLMMQLIV